VSIAEFATNRVALIVASETPIPCRRGIHRPSLEARQEFGARYRRQLSEPIQARSPPRDRSVDQEQDAVKIVVISLHPTPNPANDGLLGRV